MNQKKVVILLSGGLDSATVVAMAKADGYACYTMSFDYGQRHRADRRRQAVAGEVAEQHVHAAGRLVGGQQQVAVEQREGRLQVAHVAGVQAAGMGHLVEHRLGHPLFVEQVLVVPDDQVALLQHRSLQQVQASHGVDLGFEDHPVVRLGEEVVAARLQALHQRLGFAEGGEEDDRHQLFASLLLDPCLLYTSPSPRD